VYLDHARKMQEKHPDIPVFAAIVKNLEQYDGKMHDYTDKDLHLTSIDEILAPPAPI